MLIDNFILLIVLRQWLVNILTAFLAKNIFLGFFSSLKEDEKRNYLARGELQLYITTIIREQLTNLAREKDPKFWFDILRNRS